MMKIKYLKEKTKKYKAFSLIQMLIALVILAMILLAINNVIVTMMRTSNVISSRMLVREESEYIAEVIRKYLRNSSVDNVKIYSREDPEITLSQYGVSYIDGEVTEIDFGEDTLATEIHFRPSADSVGRVVCIGFFENEEDGGPKIGYIVRAVSLLDPLRGWTDYEPEDCFPPDPSSDQMFRKNLALLNSDLISIEGFSVKRDRTNANVYYSVDLDVRPVWGVGGLSNYRDEEGTPKYRKSFVVQTRQFFHW
jgi:competence protein ComGF